MHATHSTRALVCILTTCLSGWSSSMLAQPQQPVSLPPAPTFTIFVRGTPVGSEQIRLEGTGDGWAITGSGRIGGPLDLIIRRLQIRYDSNWHPLGADLDYSLRGQATVMTTSITGTSARNEIVTGGQIVERTDTIDPLAVLLPNPFIAPYVALAARLRTAEEGTSLSGYVAPNGSLTIAVGSSSTERIQTLDRLIEARRTQLTLQAPKGLPLAIEVWADEQGQLLRLRIPSQTVDAVREDVGSVAARRVTVSRDSDEHVRIPANGFSLSGTVSRPPDAADDRLPAIILVGGSGPVDRDEVTFGIPIFGHLSSDLADAGFLVLRYDKRGVGQSGGRPEAATLEDYAEDLRSAVRFMSDRQDVDRRRIAVVGHSEGSAVAMIAAKKEKRIRVVGLIAGIGVTGAQLNMEQVIRGLNRSTRTDAEHAEVIELQKRIQEAVLTGNGWDEIPEQYRERADIPWFKSFLEFDPAELMKDIRQPLLIIQPMLDSQVDPANADRLAELARARRRSVPVEVVKLEGLNHLLVPATTGEFEEYASLGDERVSPMVARAIAGWLPGAFDTVP